MRSIGLILPPLFPKAKLWRLGQFSAGEYAQIGHFVKPPDYTKGLTKIVK